jgi:hypothetical protein
MSCITFFAQPLAMATTQLARMVRSETASVWQFEDMMDRKLLSMSWVVVTDSNGNRKLQMQWAPSADSR